MYQCTILTNVNLWDPKLRVLIPYVTTKLTVELLSETRQQHGWRMW
jgi:hypothetical protein